MKRHQNKRQKFIVTLRLGMLITLSLASLGMLGCGRASTTGNRSPDKSDEIEAVATVGMVADLVREIGGQHVNVKQICRSGVDPHLYEATRDDIASITSADIVFYCGLFLEGKMVDKLEKVGNTKPVVAIAETIATNQIFVGNGPNSGHGDPHVWNDVSRWRTTLDVIERELAELAPQHASEFAANAKRYGEQLDALHRWGVKITRTIPHESRLLVTSHDAFHYFGEAYAIDVEGVQGISTSSEAGLQRINALVDTLIERNVKAVFIESSVDPKNIEALMEGVAARGHKVVVGGTLYSDAMGAEGTYEGTYIGMLDHNLTTVTRALGGTVDAGGFQGKLALAKRDTRDAKAKSATP